MSARARGDGLTPAKDGRKSGLPAGTAPGQPVPATPPVPPPGSVRASLAPAFAVDGVERLVVEPGAAGPRLAGPDGHGRATLTLDPAAEDVPVLILDPPPAPGPPRRGVRVREVVLHGWRVEVEVEPAHLAALRERATRGHGAAGSGGPTEVRAIIPGRVIGVSVGPGDGVVSGQQMLVVEAMKMQNELRAPRDGRIERVAVAVGQTIEVGDLLLVLT